MAETVVQMRDVTKRYRRDAFELKVLRGITLDVEEGDFVALMGPSGSGKSTLLNLLAGIDQPSSGELNVAGAREAPAASRQGPVGVVRSGGGRMIKLIRRNLLRNKRRTFLTMASPGHGTVHPGAARRGQRRNELRRRIGDPGPARGAQCDLAHVPAARGVRGAAADDRSCRGGDAAELVPRRLQGHAAGEPLPRFTIDPDTYRDVFYDVDFNEEEWEAFAAQRTAFAAGRTLAETQGWAIGDVIAIQGDIFPINVELELRAIFDSEEERQERQIFFHRRYVEEALGNPGQNGTYWLLLDDPDAAPAVIAAAEAMFENSDNQVRAETAEAFAASFTEMLGNVQFFFSAIGLAVAVSIFLITANTMAMAARERTTEVSVLRTLGFRRNQVIGMVIGESLLVGVFGSVLGLGLTVGAIGAVTPALDQMGFAFGGFGLDPQNAFTAVGLGVAIGLFSGVFPAVAAARMKIVDGLRRV